LQVEDTFLEIVNSRDNNDDNEEVNKTKKDTLASHPPTARQKAEEKPRGTGRGRSHRHLMAEGRAIEVSWQQRNLKRNKQTNKQKQQKRKKKKPEAEGKRMPCKTGNRHRHEPTKSKPRRPWSCNYTRLTIHCYKRHKRDRDRFKRINVHLVTSHAPRLPPPGYRPLATALRLLPSGCCPPVTMAMGSPLQQRQQQ